ncbi:hypothetical protein [Sorangium sp. So ce131]|uniref:hypothetical protein n=1 Tax=Sorangium sp. So ce131 TaxID=3133282 RepID=UPI003F607C96
MGTPSRRSRRAAREGALLCAALALACSPERGTPYLCTCTFVTDFDDDSRLSVEVCSPSDARAEGFGRGCAQTHAPGPVSGCTCSGVPGRGPCELNACRTTAAAP